MTSDTSEIPIYAYIITIALLCIVYALVAAGRARYHRRRP